MKFTEFVDKMAVSVQERLGGDYEVSAHEVVKNNSTKLTGLIAKKRDSNISPTIYLNPFYHAFERGELNSFDDAVSAVLRAYRENSVNGNFNIAAFTDYEKVKRGLRGKLINTEMNREYLKTLPHREFLDLSLVYFVSLGEAVPAGVATITVNTGHMAVWGVTEQELFEQAKKNMETADDMEIKNLSEILQGIMNEPVWESEATGDIEVPLYFAGTKDRMNGAAVMICEKVMKKAAEIIGRDFMIIPSSIHEVLLTPSTDEPERLACMVREVNDTQVAEDEVLSYHVYRYCHSTGDIAIAA